MYILIVVGFVATFIGTLSGSGGMINFPMMLLLGVPVHSAIAANKFANMFSSFSSFYVLLRKNDTTLKLYFLSGAISLIGGISGGLIASSISRENLTIIALFLLTGALILTFIKTKRESSFEDEVKQLPVRKYPFLFGIGAYDGMFGPGQGTMQMQLFLRNGLSYMRTVSFTRFNTFLSCTGAVVTYYFAGHYMWNVAIPLMFGSICGAQVAVKLAPKLKTKQVTILMRTVTVMLILQLIIQWG
ncbi:sulfite exporter TauE/SafE family protein [Fictibacillus phosphorivorans]|uniref:sulfite exporter TauE/SafE family protein n=1 Tax=Fictibacillus phosphorivorans TaxID=1221500 RepID=UPI00203D82AC|nr:sulfite exporter TauE/SafE family protein [Fictibacillus phosphorivorans]MCM3776814.1 sulfite exporter TauE/SafE family protein [Fictibacillus phosphorivorans]